MMKYFKRKGILLIDDDRSFGELFKAAAAQRNLPLDHFESLDDLGSIALLGTYDVGVFDYHLPGVNGLEIAEYLQAFFPNLPVILISSDYFIDEADRDVPANLKFVPKSLGILTIIETVCKHSLRSPRPEISRPVYQVGERG